MAKSYAFLAEYRSKLDDKNTLIIHVGSNDDNMRDFVATATVDGKIVPATMVRRDTIRSRFCYKTQNVFFNCEYQFLIPVSDDFKKLKFELCFRDELQTAPMVFYVKGNRYRKVVNNISGYIDSIKHTDNKIHISGWVGDALDTKVMVYNGSNPVECEVKYSFRKDIKEYYLPEESDNPNGYEIILPEGAYKRLNIVYSNDAKRTDHIVDLSKENGSIGGFSQNFMKIRDYTRKYGLKVMLSKAWNKIFDAYVFDYDCWAKDHGTTKEELEEQKNVDFAIKPKFSIVVPVFNPVDKFFEAMVKSVLDQTYTNWELCIGDGGKSVKPILDKIAPKDERIKYVHINSNLGISGNTNEAIALSTGDYIVLGDHDDLLSPDALYWCAKEINDNPTVDVIYSDEDKIEGNKRKDPSFKPDYNIDYLRSMNYICHLFVFSKEVLEKAGGFRTEFDGAQDYDMIFRCCEVAQNIVHIPRVLYSWRMHEGSTAINPESKRYAFENGKKAIEAHLDRIGVKGKVSHVEEEMGSYRVEYDLTGNPKISIIVPNKDHIEDLDKCIRSIVGVQDYDNYEIIVVENNSTEDATFSYYDNIQKEFDKVKVIYWKDEFNYSAINNFGVENCDGEYILLLNNDTEMLDKGCLRELLSYCMRPEVGIVGAKLLYEDDTIQHAGVIIGLGGIAAHAFVNEAKDNKGYRNRCILAHDLSAVTAACLMTKRTVFNEVGGLETGLKVAFNDIDYCLKVRKAGHLVVFNPNAVLHHYESKSRGFEDTREKIERFEGEITFFSNRWKDFLEKGDPYYNINLTLMKPNFSLKE